jgi:hypothetical protein
MLAPDVSFRDPCTGFSRVIIYEIHVSVNLNITNDINVLAGIRFSLLADKTNIDTERE